MKTKEQVLEQTYMSAYDLKIVIPELGINACTKFISEVQEEMKQKGYYIVPTKKKLALTSLVKERLGINEKEIK